MSQEEANICKTVVEKFFKKNVTSCERIAGQRRFFKRSNYAKVFLFFIENQEDVKDGYITAGYDLKNKTVAIVYKEEDESTFMAVYDCDLEDFISLILIS